MRSETVTLVLSGEVSLAEFARAISTLRTLLNALGEEVGDGVKIDWGVDDLERGSTIAAFRGVARRETQQPQVERVVKAYGEVGLALENRYSVPYSPKVDRAAKRLKGILNGRVDSMRFETEEIDAIVHSTKPADEDDQDAPPRFPAGSYGAVEGRVQTLTNRGGLRFTLYDLLNDRAVSCYLREGQEDTMLNLWGRLVTVEGMVRRDPMTGAPQTVRQITTVQPMGEAESESYRSARGVLPIVAGGLMPEEAIRRLRDA